MLQPYFVKGLIGKVLAYGGLQIRKYIPHGLQIHADKYGLTNCLPPSLSLLRRLQINADKKVVVAFWRFWLAFYDRLCCVFINLKQIGDFSDKLFAD